jgi:hypothetical protein
MEVVDCEELNVSGSVPHLRELRDNSGSDDGRGAQRHNPRPTRHDRE